MRIFLAWPVLVLCLLVASPCPAEVKVLRFGVNEDPYFRRPFTALYKEVNRHLKNIRIELVPLPGERTIVELAESRLDGGAVRAMGFKAMYKGVDLPNVFQLRNPLMKAGFYLRVGPGRGEDCERIAREPRPGTTITYFHGYHAAARLLKGYGAIPTKPDAAARMLAAGRADALLELRLSGVSVYRLHPDDRKRFPSCLLQELGGAPLVHVRHRRHQAELEAAVDKVMAADVLRGIMLRTGQVLPRLERNEPEKTRKK